jgi:hypothetical protein
MLIKNAILRTILRNRSITSFPLRLWIKYMPQISVSIPNPTINKGVPINKETTVRTLPVIPR